MTQPRTFWVDYAKGIAIFCVILLHTGIPDPYREAIYTTIIPLFFFLSGAFSNPEKYPNIYNFIKKRSFKTLIPYFWFNIITFTFWLLIGRHVGLDSNNETSVLTPLYGILWGRSEYLIHYVPLWFLASLFSTEIICYLVFKKTRSIKSELAIIVSFIILGYINYSYNKYILAWGIDIALSMIVFYRVGYILKDKILNQNLSPITNIPIIIFTSTILYFVIQSNTEVNVHTNNFGNYVLFFVGAINGIAFSVSVCKIIEYRCKPLKGLLFIGKNTLIILSLHLICISAFKAVLKYVLKIDYTLYDHTFYYSIISSIFSIAILIPVILIINKYGSFLLANNNYKQISS